MLILQGFTKEWAKWGSLRHDLLIFERGCKPGINLDYADILTIVYDRRRIQLSSSLLT
jgi:hypothetical protein